MKVQVEWELDGLSPEEAGVPKVVELPTGMYLIGDEEITEYLSNTYGWLVLKWTVIL